LILTNIRMGLESDTPHTAHTTHRTDTRSSTTTSHRPVRGLFHLTGDTRERCEGRHELAQRVNPIPPRLTTNRSSLRDPAAPAHVCTD